MKLLTAQFSSASCHFRSLSCSLCRVQYERCGNCASWHSRGSATPLFDVSLRLPTLNVISRPLRPTCHVVSLQFILWIRTFTSSFPIYYSPGQWLSSFL
jgi:hypothetical protein